MILVTIKRTVKVNLNESASVELRAIAEELGIPETEVLRKGLLLMRLYTDLKRDKENPGSLLLKDEDGVRELVIA